MNIPIRARRARAALALGLLAWLSACALGDRAEALYLQQHRASAALTQAIVAAESERPALAERLYETEADLGSACAPLRQAGYRRFSGQAIDGDLEWAVYRALDACAAQTAQVEHVLRDLDPETAEDYPCPAPASPATDLTAIGFPD